MRSMTREKAERRYAQGSGQGHGPDYKPWIGVQDIPSKGVSYRPCGRKTGGRQHALLSRLERGVFLAVQWLPEVTDIREQFPLWSLDATIAIAERLGVKHPTYPGGGLVVMTTDLLLTLRNGCDVAVSVKPSRALANRRTLEKLEIERLYWSDRHIRWGLVTEREVPTALARSLLWLDEYYELSAKTVAAEVVIRCEPVLLDMLRHNPMASLNQVCLEADEHFGFEGGTSLAIVRHALARRRWRVPLGERLAPAKPLPPVTLALEDIMDGKVKAA
jgi:hypothetical protein